MRAVGFAVLALVCALGIAGCERSELGEPEMQGPAAMVRDGEASRLWVLSKVEERRGRSVGGGGLRDTPDWYTDTYYHFEVEGIDPVTTKTSWKQRLVTYGDPKAEVTHGPSRVIGHGVEGHLLGQVGDIVWLLIGDFPYAVSAHDGHLLVDGPGIEAANPSLKGLLPSEARHYGFDQGLVFTSADARQFVVRGANHVATEYSPSPAPAPAPPPRKANGMPVVVPMLPMGEVPLRNTTLGGQWLGLYSPKEAEDILDDSFGRALLYPYTVLDEGGLARRNFLRAKTVVEPRFDESITHVAQLTPVPGAPVFLKGRFVKDPANDGQALRMQAPAGLLVWHATRMDSAGQLALARVDESLRTVWRKELPLSETDVVRRVASWQLPGRMLVVGDLDTVDDGLVHHRDPYLVSIDLATGAVTSRKLSEKE